MTLGKREGQVGMVNSQVVVYVISVPGKQVAQ